MKNIKNDVNLLKLILIIFIAANYNASIIATKSARTKLAISDLIHKKELPANRIYNKAIVYEILKRERTKYLLCNICPQVFPSKSALKIHEKTHNEKNITHKNTIYICDHCDKSYDNKYKLKYHIRDRHSNTEKKHKCNQCNYATNHKSSLKTHLKYNHKEKKLFKCNQCDYTTKHKGHFDKHKERKHKKGFLNTQLDRIINQLEYLEKELEIQPELFELGFSMTDENESPSTSSSALKHKKPISTIYYICDHCDKFYTNKYKLKYHIRDRHSNIEKI